jgi:Phage Mu protein F like protein
VSEILKQISRQQVFSSLPLPDGSRQSLCAANVSPVADIISALETEELAREIETLTAANEDKTLNKPFRTPKGPKKFSVYVKNDKGNIVKVNFGDPNMEIKRDDPKRRKNFRARHGCDKNPGPKWKAKYWSCKMWSQKPVSQITSSTPEVESAAQDIESLFVKAQKQHAFSKHDKLRDKAAAIYKRAIDRVLKKAKAEVLKNITEHYNPEAVQASHKLSPNDLKPALLVKGKPVTGGKHHVDIAENHGNDAKKAVQHDRNHVFVDKDGKVYDRHQAATAIGFHGALHSHDLEKLQSSEPRLTSESYSKVQTLADTYYSGDFLKAMGAIAMSQHDLKPEFVKAATTPAGVQINFSLTKFAEAFMSAMNDAAEDAWIGTHEGLLEELGAGEKITTEGLAKDFIERRANKISGCPEAIWKQIDRQIREGIQEGETMEELKDRVDESFEGLSEGRAMLIAQTESQCLYGAAQADAIESAGFKTKRWVSMDDSLVRPTHQACEDEGSIPVEQAFSNGLMFPGDPDADDAGEVCNCRCYLAAGEEDEDEAYEEGA